MYTYIYIYMYTYIHTTSLTASWKRLVCDVEGWAGSGWASKAVVKVKLHLGSSVVKRRCCSYILLSQHPPFLLRIKHKQA